PPSASRRPRSRQRQDRQLAEEPPGNRAFRRRPTRTSTSPQVLPLYECAPAAFLLPDVGAHVDMRGMKPDVTGRRNWAADAQSSPATFAEPSAQVKAIVDIESAP